MKPPRGMALHEALNYKDWDRANSIVDERLASPDADRPLDETFGGKLPIHLACEHGAPASLVGKLIAAHPACVVQPAEETGKLPLHFAVGEGPECPLATVQLLLAALRDLPGDADSDSCMVDATGRTPLHAAVRTGAGGRRLVHPEVFDLLLGYAPGAAAAADSKGLLPLVRTRLQAAAAMFARNVSVSVGVFNRREREVHMTWPHGL